MKRYLLLLFLTMYFSLCLFAQIKPYNVVFDLTSEDTSDQKSVIRWLKAISTDRPDAKLEVVLYGKSLGMITKEKSAVSKDIEQLLVNKNISFKVCAMAMKRHNIEMSQLLPGIETVQDGIYEIITKQGEGWGYIKAAR